MSYFSLYRPIPLGGNVRGNCPDTLLTMFTGACNSSFCAKCSHGGCLNGYACEPSLQIPSGNVHTVMEPWQCGIFSTELPDNSFAKTFSEIQKTFESEYFQFPLVTLFDIHYFGTFNSSLCANVSHAGCFRQRVLLWSLTSVVIFQVNFEITPS